MGYCDDSSLFLKVFFNGPGEGKETGRRAQQSRPRRGVRDRVVRGRWLRGRGVSSSAGWNGTVSLGDCA